MADAGSSPRMPAAQVHRPLLKGRQPVAGLWFPADWLHEAARAQRILDAWRPGAQLSRFEAGDLLRFAQPVLLDGDAAAGWPLRREGATLCSAELAKEERALLPAADVWLVQGGEVRPLQFAQAVAVDPSEWLAGGPALLDTFDCRELLPEPVVLDTEGRTVRELLGDAIPPASQAQVEFLQKLAQDAKARRAPSATEGDAEGKQPRYWLAWVAFALVLLGFLMFNAQQPGGSSSATASTSPFADGSAGAFLGVMLLVALAVWGLRAFHRRASRQPRPRVPLVPTPPPPVQRAERTVPMAGPAGRPSRQGWVWVLVAFALLGLYLAGEDSRSPTRATTPPAAAASQGVVAPDGTLALVLLASLVLIVLASWALWRRQERARARREIDVATRKGAPAPAPATLPPRGEGQPQRSRWRDWLARMAVASRLSKLIGRQQAAYMQRMLKMFDDGDLMEALRHAIPLGGEGHDAFDGGQAFGTPGRRDNLSLSGALGPRSSIYLGHDFETHLRQLYRRSFEKLDREGRIDEAVFVLAELLQSRQEALDYLEKHGRALQAAELALAWDRPSVVIVRLLCLAGDWRRAVAVARRDNAFAQAVLQLQDKWPDAANRLRLEWGEALAQRGEWLRAVDAVWPLPAAREQAIAWLLAAEAAEGQLAARALVQRAVLLPDTLAACAPRLRALRDDPRLHRERAALATELLAVTQHNDGSRGLAAAVIPALVADHAHGEGRLGAKEMQGLLRLHADPLLQADMPGGEMPGLRVVPLLSRPSVLALEAPAAGAHPVHDATLLEPGRYLLALGEAGVLVCDAAGRSLARFPVPADRLVAAYSGQVALALARRDGLWRVSRIDLVQRRVVDLGMIAVDGFGMEFDGIGWTVTRANRIQVLDTARSLQEVLWQVADLPGPVLDLRVTQAREQFVVADPSGTPTLWRYGAGQRRLQSREAIAKPEGVTSMRLLHPDFGAFHLIAEDDAEDDVDGEAKLRLHWHITANHAGELRVSGREARTLRAQVDMAWLVTAVQASGSACRVQWLRVHDGGLAATLHWPGEFGPRMRPVADGWLLFDGEGRVLHLDTECSTSVSFGLR
ncbi:bpX6 domain-containing protein [Variovorax sp.]|uniref:bpX6 domain-containing protein n=1 Tax=Variovorax sp. TaxID=1871043 RepID=UPI001382A9F8|nr:bpX6 domain-containing protein [Variovorax sp.]KAF1066304.1 MAG: hypothetical protein GAK39_04993 [Variovorax sp.]